MYDRIGAGEKMSSFNPSQIAQKYVTKVNSYLNERAICNFMMIRF